jgi:hypothetical protein
VFSVQGFRVQDEDISLPICAAEFIAMAWVGNRLMGRGSQAEEAIRAGFLPLPARAKITRCGRSLTSTPGPCGSHLRVSMVLTLSSCSGSLRDMAHPFTGCRPCLHTEVQMAS